MPITTLDKQSALIVIDLQKGLSALPLLHPMADIAARAAMLLDAFRRHALPVVLVNVSGRPPGRTERIRPPGQFSAEFTDFLPILKQQADDHVVTKRTPGAFTHTDLEAYLRSRGVTQVVLAGVASSNGVEATARQAYELGFNLCVAIDAVTDADAEAHTHSVTRIFPKIGETDTSAVIINLLDKEA
jgi:nicotinamidase-related amidase